MQMPLVEGYMRVRILHASLLLVIAVLFSIGSAPPATGQPEPLITVLNPAVSSKIVERVPLGPRLDTLEGKTVYMVDMQWGGPEAAYSVFEEMQGWFSRNMPSVKTAIRRISGGPFAADDPALMKEIAQNKVDALIIGIGG